MRQKLFSYIFDNAPIAGFLWIGGFLFGIISITSSFSNRDIYIKFKDYRKAQIVIDSIDYSNTDGQSSAAIWWGFSKDLDNYQTKIDIGTLGKERQNDFLQKVAMKTKFYIWYNPIYKKAHLARKEDKQYPIKEFWISEFYKYLFVLITYLNFIYWKNKK